MGGIRGGVEGGWEIWGGEREGVEGGGGVEGGWEIWGGEREGVEGGGGVGGRRAGRGRWRVGVGWKNRGQG